MLKFQKSDLTSLNNSNARKAVQVPLASKPKGMVALTTIPRILKSPLFPMGRLDHCGY